METCLWFLVGWQANLKHSTFRLINHYTLLKEAIRGSVAIWKPSTNTIWYDQVGIWTKLTNLGRLEEIIGKAVRHLLKKYCITNAQSCVTQDCALGISSELEHKSYTRVWGPRMWNWMYKWRRLCTDTPVWFKHSVSCWFVFNIESLRVWISTIPIVTLPLKRCRYSDCLRARRPELESRYCQEFSILYIVQTGSGAHPASYPMDTVGTFPGDKAAGG
jgi:hypothetical protein